MYKGIDVSAKQGKIDWQKVKNANIRFAMLRVAYTTSKPDKYFERNIEECNRLNIPCGVYWACYGLSVKHAIEEAKKLLEWVKPYKVEYPIAFDLEGFSREYMEDNGVEPTKELISSMAEAFGKVIEEAGYYFINYSNSYDNDKYFDSRLDKYDLWHAQWFENNENVVKYRKPSKNCGMWQYCSKGKVNGVKGVVDLNISFKNYPEIIKRNGLNNLSTKSTVEKENEILKQAIQSIIDSLEILKKEGVI